MEVAIAEMPGGYFTAQLYIEEKSPAKPYPHRTFPGATNYLAYPIFQLKTGMPPPKRDAVVAMPANLKPDQQIKWKPTETMQELPPDPVIFIGK
jgi:hypothetical protein